MFSKRASRSASASIHGLVVSLLAAGSFGIGSCSESGKELEQAVAVTVAAATQRNEDPPTREIAIVLDGGGAMGPRCTYDPSTKNVSYDPWGADWGVGYDATYCSPFDGFDQQRDALIDALRVIPVDGTIALTIVQSADRLRRDASVDRWHYEGPILLVPYTVIRSQGDLNSVINRLETARISIDEYDPQEAYFPGATCHHFNSYDLSCYGVASHAWGANVAWNELLSECQDEAPGEGTGDGGVSRCVPRGESQELCMVGALSESDVPWAFWNSRINQADTSNLYIEAIPDEALSVVPWQTLNDPDIDRVTAVAYTPGATPFFGAQSYLYASDEDEQLDLDHHWRNSGYWALALRISGEVATADTLRIDIGFSERRANGLDLDLEIVDITLSSGSLPHEVAAQIAQELQVYGDLIPITCEAFDDEVFCFTNQAFAPFYEPPFYDGPPSGAPPIPEIYSSWLPTVAVLGNVPGLTVQVSGGSRAMPERLIEWQDAALRRDFLFSAADNQDLDIDVIFPSGYMLGEARTRFGDPVNRVPSEHDRLRDFTRSVSACFAPQAELRAIEVTQGIQDWTNSVPLIEHKATSVRAFARSLDAGATMPLKVRLIGYREKAEDPGADCVAEPSRCEQLHHLTEDGICATKYGCGLDGRVTPYKPTSKLLGEQFRRNVDDSQVFDLPPHWLHGNIVLQAISPTGLACAEPVEASTVAMGSAKPGNCAVQVQFNIPQTPEHRIGITPFRVDWDGASGNWSTGNQDYFPIERMEEGRATGELLLPLARLRANATRQIVIRYDETKPLRHPDPPAPDRAIIPIPPAGTFQQRGDFIRYGVHDQLELARALECRRPTASQSINESCPDPNVFLAGFTLNASAPLGGIAGGGAAAVDYGVPQFGDDATTVAHELMHAFGRPHTNYCMTAEELPRCAEPYPFEVSIDAQSGTASSNSYAQSLTNLYLFDDEYLNRRPALGHYVHDVDQLSTQHDTTVWGFDRGHRRYIDAAGVAQDIDMYVLDPAHTWDILSYCSNNSDRWPSRFQWERLLYDHSGDYFHSDRDRSQRVEMAAGFATFVESPVRPGLYKDQFFCDLSIPDEHIPACFDDFDCTGTRQCRRWPGLQPCLAGDLDCYCQLASWSHAPDTTLRPVVLFKGWIGSSLESTTLRAVASVPELAASIDYFTQNRGEYTVTLKDAVGVTLYEIQVQGASSAGQAPSETKTQSFITYLPADPNVVEITLSSDGTELATVVPSPSPPVVNITSHQPNDTLPVGVEVVSWAGSDADEVDSDNLRYTVWYSPDNIVWQVLAVDYPFTSIEIDTDLLAGSDNAYLRVGVADQASVAHDVVGPLHVPHKAPSIAIETPLDGSSFVGDQVALFRAHAIDQEDGWIEDSAIAWWSNVDGPLGDGPQTRRASDLTAGQHTITARIVDSSGTQSEASVTINVAQFSTAPFEGASLQLEIDHTGDFQIGVPGRYEIQLQNIGAEAADDGTVVITLPAELAYEETSGDDWSCEAAGQVVTCEYEGEAIEPGFIAEPITLEVIPSDGGIDPLTRSSFTVTPTAAATFGSATAQASDETRVRIPIPPQLGTSVVVRDPPSTGQPSNYTFTVSNSGGPADAIVVTFNVPVGAVFTQGVGAGWLCELLGPQAICTYEGTLLGGETLPALTVTVVVQDANLTRVALTYSIRATSRTPAIHFDAGVPFDGGDDAALDPVIIESGGEGPTTGVTPTQPAGVDLSLAVGGPCAFQASQCQTMHLVLGPRGGRIGGDAARRRGGTWSHNIVVRNEGTLVASDPIVLTDQLPVGATYKPSSPDPDWQCSEANRLVTCQYTGQPLRPGQSDFLIHRYYIDADAPAELTNVVSVTTAGDHDLSNNTTSRTVDVLEHVCETWGNGRSRCYDFPAPLVPSGLDVQIGLTPLPLVFGEPGVATFTVVNASTTNRSTSQLVLEALGEPSMLVVDSTSGTNWTCTNTWGRARCQYALAPVLAPGASLPPLTVSYTVGPYAGGAMIVPAQVTALNTLTYRTHRTVDVLGESEELPPAGRGLIAYSACPLGRDCFSAGELPPDESVLSSPVIHFLDLETHSIGTSLWGRQVELGGAEPTWSDDGRNFAFVSQTGACDQIMSTHDCTTGVAQYMLDMRLMSLGTAAPEYQMGRSSSPWYGGPATFLGDEVLYSVPREGPCGGPLVDPTYQDCVNYNLAWGRAPHERIPYQAVQFSNEATPFLSDAQHPDYSPGAPRLAFSSGVDAVEPYKIFVAEGEGFVRLTASDPSVIEIRPAWSPDGSRIAYAANGSIRIAQVDGGAEIAVTSGTTDTHPTWSPDGTQLVFQSGGHIDAGLFIVDLAGGAPRLLTRGRHPAWQPDPDFEAPPVGNQLPVAATDVLDTAYARAASLNVLENDADPEDTLLTLQAHTQGAHGDVSCDATGLCTYTPALGFTGDDQFSYFVSDASDGQAEGMVYVQVEAISPHVSITSPAADGGVSVGTIDVAGAATLSFSDPNANVLYAIDLHSGLGGFVRYGDHLKVLGGIPIEWRAHNPQQPSVPEGLCSDLDAEAGTYNIIDCYSRLLNADLHARSDVDLGVMIFGDDYPGLGSSHSYVYMSRNAMPRDYRENTFFVDTNPAPGFQRFARGAGSDRNDNGEADLDEILRSIAQPAAGEPACKTIWWMNGGEVDTDDIVTGTTLFGPLEQPPPPVVLPASQERAYPDGLTCRAVSLEEQTYDRALRALNTAFEQQPASERNVAYLFSSGRTHVGEDDNSPLAQAARAGTVIHTFAPAARTEPYGTDILFVADTRTTTSEQDAHFAARLSELAQELAESNIDYRVKLTASKNLLSGTALASDSVRFRFIDSDTDDPIDIAPFDAETFDFFRESATLHLVAINTEGDLDMTNFARGKSFFFHAISPRGPSYCPGSEETTTAFERAHWLGGLSLLSCSDDWTELVAAFESPDYSPTLVERHRHPSMFGLAGSRPLGSCEPTNALARIAAATGGTCTELLWDNESLEVPLPPPPRLGVSGIPNDGIESVVVVRESDAPVNAVIDATGRFTAQVPGIVSGPNTLTATLYARDGLTATTQITVYGQEGFNLAPVLQPDVLRIEPGQVQSIAVLSNDSDPDGDPMTLVSVTEPETGLLECTPQGTCTYESPASFDGDDIVSYTVADGRGGEVSTTLTLHGNRAPIVPLQRARGVSTEVVAFSILEGAYDPDGDDIAFVELVGGLEPLMQGSCSALGACELIYPATFHGTDRLVFMVEDSLGAQTIGEAVVIVARAAADAAVRISHQGAFRVGNPAYYDVTVSNLGSAATSTTTVALSLPALGFMGFEGAGWSCEEDGLVMCSSRTPLDPGATLPALRIRVMPLAEAVPSTTASVMLEIASDDDFSNNYSEDPTAVGVRVQDVGIELTHAEGFDLCTPNQVAITVRELGGQLSGSNVVVQSTLPASIKSPAISGAGWNCVVDHQTFLCTHAYPSALNEVLPMLMLDVTASVAGVDFDVSVDVVGDADDANDHANVNGTAYLPLSSAVESLELTYGPFSANFVSLTNDGYAPLTTLGMWGSTLWEGFVGRNFSRVLFNEIPQSSHIVSARHRVSHTTYSAAGSRVGRGSAAFAVLAPYDRTNVTWSTQPAADYDHPYGVVSSETLTSATGHHYRDLTALVQRWVDAPSQNYGMVITGYPEIYTPSSHDRLFWRSPSDQTIASRPTLEVEFQRPVLPDADADGVYDCADNCPNLANANQADIDADGVGNFCDNCATVANPDQSDTNPGGSGDACEPIIDIRSIESESGILTADIFLDDPNDEPLNGTVSARSAALQYPQGVSVFVETLADCQDQALNLELNGIAIGTMSTGNLCVCAPGIKTQRFSGPAVEQAFNNTGTNVFRLTKPAHGGAVAWFKVTAEYSNGSTRQLCVVDYPNGQGNCQGTNLCTEGYNFNALTASATLSANAGSLIDLFSSTYLNSAISRTFNVAAAPAGEYVMTATASSASGNAQDSHNFTLAGESTFEINPGVDLTVSSQGLVVPGICGSSTYSFRVENLGTTPTTSAIVATITASQGLIPQSASGTGWTCTVQGATAQCVYEAVATVGQTLPLVSVATLVTAMPSSSIEMHANVQTAGDVSSANDFVVVRRTVSGSIPDDDSDGVPNCLDHCPAGGTIDTDGDSYCDAQDNCPDIANADQADANQDGVGDACACPDGDADDICTILDNCPLVANTNQLDDDGDGIGTACDACPLDATNDTDGDGVCQGVDNCPSVANASQANGDTDSLGDACDNCPSIANATQANTDLDALGNVCDACPLDATNDADGDGACQNVDNCPSIANATQANTDLDALGNACDACPLDPLNDTSDLDGVCDDVDNCVSNPNPDQLDTDSDGMGDPCDPCPLGDGDDDHDGACNGGDNCPSVFNNDQADSDADLAGDACDNCPGLANIGQANADGDAAGDACDVCPNAAPNDSDGDGVCQNVDNCPNLYNPTQFNNDSDSRGNACEQCPNDPNKLVPGFCGCGQLETNTDGDSVPDCEDQCPTDPNKVLSGWCGCGLSDTDTDADGYPDCGDECPNDPLKYQPELCGCGVAEGTCNNDGCPSDPLKTAPGVCGCGVADTDSDSDGTPNCNDGCPSDASKIAAGACGCGVADSDSDSDGTPNCVDGCASDPLKTVAGACGCGMADTDGDSDGTANCNDGCPSDANKVAAGACGCGVADTDSDSDGTANCNDACASDPLKIAAGVCGCGVADADGDSDGTPNCNDGCPTDANKVSAGACGCGVAETDSDSDETPNCNDACPSDANKIAAGACGCGVAETDSDGDGTPNCNDACPSDASKIAAGACGCGFADTDSDSDGTANCNDGCPSDADKSAPGICGCGVGETDSDSDGVPNCTDECDSDPLKIAVGLCGCGVADTDSDSDGTPNCDDACASDPDKIAAGACGCGTPDVDADENGTMDCLETGGQILLQTCADLQAIDNNLGASYRVLNDIDCTGFDFGDGKGFRPIGEGPSWDPFTGTLDGAGFVVTNLTIDRPEDGWVGLFGLTDGATIHRLGLVNASIEGLFEVGALIGHAVNTDVREVFASGTVVAEWHVAGLVGAPKDQTHIADCAAHVAVSSPNGGEGLIGEYMYYDALIERSYSAGTTATGDAAIVPSPQDGSIVRTSFFDCDVAGNCADAMGVPTVEMTSAAQYATAGWNFDTVWGFFEDHDYPCLRWQDGCTCVAGQDLDQDGMLDCSDGCATDPLKLAPGACGCGEVEVDSDSDGTYDCNDVCPNDPLKIERGECGCGIADVDANEDEVLDCNDPATPAGISTCAELQDITNMHGAYVLENDIDCTGFDYGDGKGFKPIASAEAGWGPFEGYFDGASHAITGLTIDRRSDTMVGLFGSAAHGWIRNVALYDVDITGDQRVGALVGHAHWVSFEQCAATGEVTGNSAVGGLVGLMLGASMLDSHATATVAALNEDDEPGLLVGGLEGEIRRSYAAGEGDGPGALAGGRGFGASSFDSFFDCEVAGNCSDADAATTESMTSIDQYAESGWDFDQVWGFSELGGYPCLRWEAGCGCVASDDFDGDSTGNCADECSTDPDKTAPGMCGCGAADIDSDSDGTLDCLDACPIDPLKIELGECGCGTADVDLNEDEVLDCNDPATPVGISSCAELQGITNMYGAYVLENDIDCTGFDYGDGRGFMPIGKSDDWSPFRGHFDGAGHVIEGLSMQRQMTWEVALFHFTYEAMITNVHLRDVSVAGEWRVGGLVGTAENTTIDRCSVTGDVAGVGEVGGLAGLVTNSAITNSYTNVVIGGWDARGLIAGRFINLYALYNSYGVGTGEDENDVALSGDFGGEGQVISSFFDCDVAGSCSATGASTTTAMQSSTLYTNAGWDFTNVWALQGSGMYPCLQNEASCAP